MTNERLMIQLNSVAKEVIENYMLLRQLNEELSDTDQSNCLGQYRTEKCQNKISLCLRRLEWTLNDLFECIDVLHNSDVNDRQHQLIESHYLMARQVVNYLNQWPNKRFKMFSHLSQFSHQNNLSDKLNNNLKRIKEESESGQTLVRNQCCWPNIYSELLDFHRSL